MTLVTADQAWLLWAILLGAGALGFRAERTRLGSRLSGAVLAMGATFLLSNLRVIPSEAPAYESVWKVFVPLAIPLLLVRANLARIVREAGPTLLAFIAGGIGTVLGTFLAFAVVPLGPEGAKLAGVFAATYVGGSMNYVAAAEALDLRSPELLSAGFAADNLVMALYFLVLFALPASAWLRRQMPPREQRTSAPPQAAPPRATPSAPTMLAALALSASVCALGFGLESLSGWRGTGILIVTATMVLLATVMPRTLGRLAGADELGTLLMQVFFAVIGASADVRKVIEAGPKLFVFAALILLVHLAVLLLAGRLLRLDLREVVIASNANMGGPTTAAAMATARGWDSLVIPAILCGTLGYALATFVGVALGHLLG